MRRTGREEGGGEGGVNWSPRAGSLGRVDCSAVAAVVVLVFVVPQCKGVGLCCNFVCVFFLIGTTAAILFVVFASS